LRQCALQSATPKDRVEAYIDGVLSGDITVGRYVRLAVERHVDDLEHAGERGYYFDERIAADECAFYPSCLVHTRGAHAGNRFELSDSQLFIVWCLFGWRRIEDKTRRFTNAYITCARKWGKSTWCAGVALKRTILDDPFEEGAQVYAVATKEEQARTAIFGEAVKFVNRNKSLKSMARAYTNAISVADTAGMPQRGSTFKPIGSDSDTSDGLDVHAVFIDELHAWQKRHNGLYDRMTTAGGSRRQALVVIITTAGDSKSEIWIRRDRFFTNVLDACERGNHTADEHFAFIARIDKGDDPFDEKNWPKANPNYPITPTPRYLRGMATEAANDPVEKNKFLRFHANVQVTSQEQAISPDLWALAGRNTQSDWKRAAAIGGGIDLGGGFDLCATARCAKFEVGKDDNKEPIYHYELTQRSWINERTKRKLDEPPYSGFIERGELIVTSREISEVCAEVIGSVDQVGKFMWAYDPHQAQHLGEILREDHRLEVFEMPQSYIAFNEPIREFLKALKEGRLWHNGDDLLGWCAGNLMIKGNQRGEWMADKESSLDKIDPIVAAFMAFRVAFFARPKKKSIYSTEGNMSL